MRRAHSATGRRLSLSLERPVKIWTASFFGSNVPKRVRYRQGLSHANQNGASSVGRACLFVIVPARVAGARAAFRGVSVGQGQQLEVRLLTVLDRHLERSGTAGRAETGQA